MAAARVRAGVGGAGVAGAEVRVRGGFGKAFVRGGVGVKTGVGGAIVRAGVCGTKVEGAGVKTR